MNETLEYKGYVGSVEFSAEDEVYFGKVLGTEDLISYEGKNIENLKKDFREAVDEYIEMCEIEGIGRKMARKITSDVVKEILRPREAHLHKGDCGRALIGAGSVGMAGAAILASRGALRAGAGLVRVAVPSELVTILQIAVPEATCVDRAQLLADIGAAARAAGTENTGGQSGEPAAEAADALVAERASATSSALAQYDAICIGPGLGESAKSIAFVKAMLSSYGGVLIVDADALNIIAHNEMLGLLRARAEHFPDTTVITPHIGEARRLLAAARTFDFTGAAPEAARLDMAAALVEATRATVILKGSGTIVAAHGREPLINTTGNPGMATGGSGDVLAGVITGIAAQKRQPAAAATSGCPAGCTQTTIAASAGASRIGAYAAAVAAVYIHGRAGDLAAVALGEYGLIAGDLPLYVAHAIRELTTRPDSLE